MMKPVTINDLGTFPAPGPEAREAKVFYHLSDEEGIRMISGSKTPALMSVWCSNDVVQFGTLLNLAGGPGPQQTEFDSHQGDAVFYALEGPVTFYLPDRGETYDVQTGDFMFIPEGERYKIVNYTGHSIKSIFMVAPKF